MRAYRTNGSSIGRVSIATAFAMVVATIGLTATPAAAAAPSNDDFVNASIVDANETNLLQTNVDATVESGEPDPTCNTGEDDESVWYDFTMTGTGTVTISTNSSTFDTLLAVYTGNSVGALTEVACDDDSGVFTESSLTFPGVLGTTYRIRVDGVDPIFSSGNGTFNLTVSAPCAETTFDVGNQAELNEAIGCFNAAPSGAYVFNITDDIMYTGARTTIDNTSPATLEINGGGHTLDADTLPFSVLRIENTTATINDIILTRGRGEQFSGVSYGGGLYTFGATVTLIDSLIEQSSARFGGGVRNAGGGTLTIINSTIRNNVASSRGGGIRNTGGATLNLVSSTVYGNGSSGFTDLGGGIDNDGGTSVITNSTISANTARDEGGGIRNAGGSVSVVYSTVTGNDASSGDGIWTENGATTTIEASIVVGGTSIGQDIQSAGGADPYVSAGYNILGTVSPAVTAFNQPGDLVNQVPNLGPLVDNGGPTVTHALLPGSPALDHITAATANQPAVDQTGETRPQGSGHDAGSLEAISCVSTTHNVSSQTALNTAIGCFNAASSGSHVINVQQDITYAGPLAVIDNSSAATLSIDGNGRSLDGNGLADTSVLSIVGADVLIDNITLTGGTGSPEGGGLRVIGSSADVEVQNSTITNNTAASGGGVANIFSGGTVTIVNSTISGNTATAAGGGIFNDDDTVTVAYSTVTGNSAPEGAGIWSYNAILDFTTVESSIVAGNNGGGRDIELRNNSGTDTFISFGYNVLGSVGSAVTAFNGSTDLVNQAPLLGSLGNNGGGTQTHELLGGSPAIDHVTGSTPNQPSTDQRGLPRPKGPGHDAGAFEFTPDGLTTLAEPCALYDSTTAAPGLAGTFSANELRSVQVTGLLPGVQGVGTAECVPAGASAVVYTISAINPQGSGNLRLSAAGVVANGGVVNYQANGLNNANTVTVPVSASGEADITANAAATDVRLVAVAYYSDAGDLLYTPLTPCAVADTRFGTGSFTGSQAVGAALPDITVVGAPSSAQGGGGNSLQADCGVPAGADAVVVNVVAVQPAAGFNGTGFLAASASNVDPSEATTPFTTIAMNNATTTTIPLNGGSTIAIDIEGDAAASSHVRVVVLGYLDTATGDDYSPVTPCAAFDTRAGQNPSGGFAGQRVAGQATTYTVTGVIPAAQGGNGGDCGVPAGASAVLVNLVAVQANTNGNFRAYATGSTPTGGILNFASLAPSMNNSNAVVVPIDMLGQLDLFVNAPSNNGAPTVHARGVILGFYN